MPIYSVLPDADALLALEPEELAGPLLQVLSTLPESELNRYNLGLDHNVAQYPAHQRTAVSRALMEAWVWLEREGLLAPRPGAVGEFVFVTRRGQQVATPEKLAAYRRANLLPRHLIHPR